MLAQVALSEVQLRHLLRFQSAHPTFTSQRNDTDPQNVKSKATSYEIDGLTVRIATLVAQLKSEFFDET